MNKKDDTKLLQAKALIEFAALNADAMRSEDERMRAEVERLREALRRIAAIDTYSRRTWIMAVQAAREALEEGGR